MGYVGRRVKQPVYAVATVGAHYTESMLRHVLLYLVADLSELNARLNDSDRLHYGLVSDSREQLALLIHFADK